jgi:energy-coupling factor transporter ATP-binding protein EcfA2
MQLPVYCHRCAGIVNVDSHPGATGLCPGCSESIPVPQAEDAFISFSFRNLDQAKVITEALLRSGIRAWLSPNRTDIGEDFLDAFSAALFNARAYVLLCSRDAVASVWVKKELLIAQERKIPCFAIMIEPVQMPQWMRTALAGCLWEENLTWPIERRLESFATSIHRRLSGEPPADAVVHMPGRPETPLLGVRRDAPPYVGPQPFDSSEAGKFFGRDAAASELIKKIKEKRTVLVYAPSGAGKTSLLKTVVRRALEDSGVEVLTPTRVGAPLGDGLLSRPDDVVNVFSCSAVSVLSNRKIDNPRTTLAGYLESLPARDQTWARVLIIDQFEELFTQHPDRFDDRAGLMRDIADALQRCPALRVVFSMREEYLAKFDEITEHMPADFPIERFWLRRVNDAEALQAITGPAWPYFEYEPDVAREIVRQLNLMQVTRPDGTVVKRRGEFIELVHLQIVCRRLWSRLPEGLKTVKMEHLKLAAGDGREFDEFVDNALVEFYDEVVSDVSKVVPKGADEGQKPFPPQLIRLGCLKFVSSTGVRMTLLRDKSARRTGRLPDWIVDELEKRHLLRAELRGGEPWYELSHDLLAETVSRERDRDLGLLLAATELIETIRKRVMTEQPEGQTGYFRPHPELLSECEPFRDQPGLFADEASLILRASLASGRDIQAWSRRVAADFPEVHDRVVREAIRCPVPTVRANVAVLLAEKSHTRFHPQLVDMAISDPDEHVRRTASEAIGMADSDDAYQRLFESLRVPAEKDACLTALSLILIQRDRRLLAPGSDQWFDTLGAIDAARVRRRARITRLRECLVVLPFLLIPSALFSACAAAFIKALPGALGWSLCQATSSFFGGIFHGATAGLIWGITLPLSLILYWEVFGSRRKKWSMLSPLGSILFASVSGFLTGLLVVISIVGVFEVANLVEIGWLDQWRNQGSREFWLDLFVNLRFGWAYAITGIGMGAGMAMATNALRARRSLATLMESDGEISTMRQIRTLIGDVRRAFGWTVWPILVLPLLTGAIALTIVKPGGMALRPKGEAPLVQTPDHRPTHADWMASKTTLGGRVLGMAGDCASELAGGYAAVVGMGVGMVIMSRGVQVRPRKDIA